VEAREFIAKLWVLMATVFVDMMGFFIVLPLLPYYAEKLGADPVRIGALVSTFALAQLTTAPLWGRFSDRYGRRPMILAGLLVSALAYVLFEAANSVWLLFFSRFVQGAGAGTVGVVQAYLSDSVRAEDRAKSFGWLTAATSAGVMVGPAVGSLAAAWGKIGPGYLAAVLCGLNFIFGLIWLTEPTGSGPRERRLIPKGAARRAVARILRHPRTGVAPPVWIYTLGMMAFMSMNGVLALYLERKFAITEATIGWFFVYVGGISLLMRTLALGPAIRRLGEMGAMRLGASAIAVGLATIPLADALWQLALAVLLIPVGTALLFPTTNSWVSRRAQPGETGLMLGTQQSFGGVARMIGPIWAGAVFQHFGMSYPFYLAAAVMVAAALFAFSLRSAEVEGVPTQDKGVE
jgi:multidrug resistance protein